MLQVQNFVNEVFLKLLSKPKNPPLIKIGKVSDAKSLKGELKIHVFSGESTWLDRITYLYIDLNGEKKKYEFQKGSFQKGKLIVKLKEINDRTQAEALIGGEVFIEEKYFQSKIGEKIF